MYEERDPVDEAQWNWLAPLMPGGCRGKRGRADNRRLIDAIFWMARSGGPWRDLPERFGDYRTVQRRHY
ncbi:transposase [Rhizobium gallicum]|uniref:transposase n=1 Tax=Rhizobium gallicum TaxID=56730 RepID=UPI003B8A7B6B